MAKCKAFNGSAVKGLRKEEDGRDRRPGGSPPVVSGAEALVGTWGQNALEA